MKNKIYLSALMVSVSILTCNAQTEIASPLSDYYEGMLVVSINGTSTPPTEETIEIHKHDESNLIDLRLNNFKLVTIDKNGDMGLMYIGNISITDIALEEHGDTVFIEKSQETTIAAGDSPSDVTWIGPFIGNVPIELKGKAYGKNLSLTININMIGLGQTIRVDFSSGLASPTSISIPKNTNGPCGVYTIQGHRVASSAKDLPLLPKGVYVAITEGRSSKIIVR